MRFEGAYPAMVTPFTDEEEIDVEGMRSNIAYLEKGGVAGWCLAAVLVNPRR